MKYLFVIMFGVRVLFNGDHEWHPSGKKVLCVNENTASSKKSLTIRIVDMKRVYQQVFDDNLFLKNENIKFAKI